MGMPWAESRLMENPQVKKEPASCQKASVCTASLPRTRSMGGAVAPGVSAACWLYAESKSEPAEAEA